MSALEKSVQGWETGTNQTNAHFRGSEHDVSQNLAHKFTFSSIKGIRLPEQIESDEVNCLIVRPLEHDYQIHSHKTRRSGNTARS